MITYITGRIKYRGLESERLAFDPGGVKRIGAQYFSTDTKVIWDWDGTQWVIPVPIWTFEQIYPVGVIYSSMNATNPNIIFGEGTWVKIMPPVVPGANTWKRTA